ncbi:unnamed protein product [Parnassius mnemosyne]|uniref:Fe2OG dioxygenase domain-containing protein n=1 Tax=Parnassius mnemosyne TaxID=213953 RepID=A0AAV1KAH6_9NEOP
MTEDKKVDRKCKRFAARLKSKGISCSNMPGPNLVLCNVGQATGLVKDDILNLCNYLPAIKLRKFIAEKGESYSFLVFDTKESASVFFNEYNGKNCFNNGTFLYMCYVDSVPDTEVLCPYSNPEGLLLVEDFINIDEEKAFVDLFNFKETNSSLKNRQVKHFGYEFRYGSNDVDLNSPLPDKIPKECDILWTRLKSYGIDLDPPDQLTVNKYMPGQGIPSHVDKHSPFGPTILSLSLGSSVVMDWKHHSGKSLPIIIPARSMLVMQGEARYDWQHGIQPRTWDPIIEYTLQGNQRVKVITSDTTNRQTRISLTFRWTRSGKCDCPYKTLCDASNSTEELDDAVASNLEELHVHQVYERIAEHFSSTRHSTWPRVLQFLRQVPSGAVLLDLGAGNGKNLLHRTDILQIAGERSSGLLNECKSYVGEVGTVDCVRLDLLQAGLKDSCADFIICIAVIHHFSTQSRRVQAVATIARLLRPGGRALITVWAKDQTRSNYLCREKDKEVQSNSTVEVAGLTLPVHENRTQFQHKDLLVPWKLRGMKENKLADKPECTLLRYYHVFEEGELDELCELSSLLVESSFYEEGNWCVVCKKI